MKKLAQIFIIIFFTAGVVNAGVQPRQKNTIQTAVTAYASAHGTSGSSIYIIDTKSPAYSQPIKWNSGESIFSIQMSGVTCGAEKSTGELLYQSGASFSLYHAASNYLPDGFTTKTWTTNTGALDLLEWTNIISGTSVDVQLGNTRYVYDFPPKRSRYVLLKATSGITTVFTDLYIDMD